MFYGFGACSGPGMNVTQFAGSVPLKQYFAASATAAVRPCSSAHQVLIRKLNKALYHDFMKEFPFQEKSAQQLTQEFSDEVPKPTQADRAAFEAARQRAAEMPSQERPRLNFKFDRSLTGGELAAALKDSLIQHGIDPGDVLVRFFSHNRLSAARQTGTDRDRSANVDYNGAADGESEWMRGLGIWSNDQVTYVSPLSSYISGGADAPKAQGNCYVIYDKNFMHKVGHASNGFHAFLSSPQRALVGFMSDDGDIPLARASLSAAPSQPQP